MDQNAKKNIILGSIAGVLLIMAAVIYFSFGSSKAIPGSDQAAKDMINELKEQPAPPPSQTPPGGRQLKK